MGPKAVKESPVQGRLGQPPAPRASEAHKMVDKLLKAQDEWPQPLAQQAGDQQDEQNNQAIRLNTAELPGHWAR